MDDYVSKPVTPEELERVLRRWVGAPTAPAEKAVAATPAAGEAPRRGDRGQPDVVDDDGTLMDEVVPRSSRSRPSASRPSARRPRATRRSSRRAAHSFLGSCGNLGARRMADLCARLECSPLGLDRGRGRDRAHPRGGVRGGPAPPRGPARPAPEAGRPGLRRHAVVIRDALRAVVEALFRVLFTYDCVGEEKIPPSAARDRANHPSYLDPVLLSLQVKRPILSWPGTLSSARPSSGLSCASSGLPRGRAPGRGSEVLRSAEAARPRGEPRRHLPGGQALARGLDGEELPRGGGRLALETGAPLVPATIRGRSGRGPTSGPCPGPRRSVVRYHDPIDPAPYRPRGGGGHDRTSSRSCGGGWRRRSCRVKADRRSRPSTARRRRGRALRAVPALGLALLVFWKTRSFALIGPAYATSATCCSTCSRCPSALTKWIRNGPPLPPSWSSTAGG